MNPEEYLDRLIERRERGEVQIPVANDEVAASLAAAEVLAQLRKIDVPTGFAGHLELYVRAHARGLAQQNGSAAPIERLRSPAGLPRFQMRQTWIAILRDRCCADAGMRRCADSLRAKSAWRCALWFETG